MENFKFFLCGGTTILVTENDYDTFEIENGDYYFLKHGQCVVKVFGKYIMAYERW